MLFIAIVTYVECLFVLMRSFKQFVSAIPTSGVIPCLKIGVVRIAVVHSLITMWLDLGR